MNNATASKGSFVIEVNNQLIHVHVVRHKRARCIKLVVRDHQYLRLTLPLRATLKEAQAFVGRVKPWIAKKLDERMERVPFVHGAPIPILGNTYTLDVKISNVKKVVLDGNVLRVGAPQEMIDPLIRSFLAGELEKFCLQTSQFYAEQLGLFFNSIQIKNMRTRWGSCSSKGNLVFAWHLVFLPTEIVRYVCAHEVAHLLVMNHSQLFWEKVGEIYPEYKEARLWIKQNGKNVWRYG